MYFSSYYLDLLAKRTCSYLQKGFFQKNDYCSLKTSAVFNYYGDPFAFPFEHINFSAQILMKAK